MADNTSSSQEELEETSERQMPEVHSDNAFNTALSSRASCNHLCKHLHHAKWLAPSSASKGGGKVGCLAPAAINTVCALAGQLVTAAGLCLWPDPEKVMLTAVLVVPRFDISGCLVKPWEGKTSSFMFQRRE